MKTFTGFEDWHKSKLKEVCGESLPDPNGVNGVCRELGLLPLMFDMSGCYAIRANGEIVSFLYDDKRDLRLETDPRILNIALFQGSKKYPELNVLIPSKPDDAVECPHCDGTGNEKWSAKHGLDFIVCYCGGLGWLPPETADLSLTEDSK
ncbi:MAG: hypothetical protein SF097_21770 [Acidobacteriota bacterium]|nr:hypothetical protein [Acidobacteriota bacterium]